MLSIVVTFMIVQTIRYNSKSSNIKKIEFTDLSGKKVKLENLFNKKNIKYILYVLPECGGCIERINELSKNSNFNNSQLIVISVGLKNFNYEQYYQDNYKEKNIIFLIDKENNFYKNFGLGFSENFPTLIEYNLKNDIYKKVF